MYAFKKLKKLSFNVNARLTQMYIESVSKTFVQSSIIV